MSLEQSLYAHGSGAMGCEDIPQEMGGLPRTGGDRIEKHELDHLLPCHRPYAIASSSSGSGTLPQLDCFCCSRRQQER